MQGEAAAYETLKKLSQSRQATEFVTALILNHLAAEAGQKNGVGLQNRNDSPVIKDAGNIQAQSKGQGTNAFIEEDRAGITKPEVKHEYTTQTSIPDERKDVSEKPSEVSQEGLAAAMEIFGF